MSRPQKGQTLVLFAFALIALVGFTALAADGGRLLSLRRKTKMAADAGAMAAGYAWAANRDYSTKAQTVVAKNGLPNATTTVEELSSEECAALVEDTTPGAQCTCFRVTVHAEEPSAFAQLVGLKALSATSSSVVHVCKTTPLEYGYVIRTKNDLTFTGGGGAMAWGRVRADHTLTRSGMGHGWSFGTFPIPFFGGEITAGEDIVCNGSIFFCNPMMDMMALGPQIPVFGADVEDHVQRPPMAELDLPEPNVCAQVTEPVTCAEFMGLDALQSEMMSMVQQFASAGAQLPFGQISNFSGFTGFGSFGDMISSWQDAAEETFADVENDAFNHCWVYPPGKHTSRIQVSGDTLVFFMPGPHCLTKDLHIAHGVVMGHDVSFYFEDGSGVTVESGSQVFLDAGKFGEFDLGGMLFYRPSEVQIGAITGSMLNGSIYTPDGDCNLEGQGMLMGWGQLICNNARLAGGFNAMLMYNADYIYHIPADLSLIK